MFRIIYSAFFVLVEVFAAITTPQAWLAVIFAVFAVIWIFLLIDYIKQYAIKRENKRKIKQTKNESYAPVNDEWRNRW